MRERGMDLNREIPQMSPACILHLSFFYRPSFSVASFFLYSLIHLLFFVFSDWLWYTLSSWWCKCVSSSTPLLPVFLVLVRPALWSGLAGFGGSPYGSEEKKQGCTTVKITHPINMKTTLKQAQRLHRLSELKPHL